MIIETDLGHDPDDFFAITWLAASGIEIDALVITPGDIDQIAFANLLRDELGQSFPIGVSKLDRNKRSSGSIHYDLLKKYDYFRHIDSYKNRHDGEGVDVLYSVFDGTQDFLVIGPATNIGKFLCKSDYENYKVGLTMQGGFLPYNQNPHLSMSKYLSKFTGQTHVPSFNMNGDIEAVERIINTKLNFKRWVGKHICHDVIFNKSRGEQIVSNDTVGAELFLEGMDYLWKHTDGKKFHDPLAAIASINLDPFKFINVHIQYSKGLGWTAYNGFGDCEMIADLDEEKFWNILGSFNSEQ